jgi:hypothetical protein
MAEEAQPTQGQDPNGGGLYDSYLQFVPPDRQQEARAHLEEVSRTVNSRLEEAASLRNTYEPYKEAGLELYTPEEFGQLAMWHQNIAAHPDTFRDWLMAASQEAGLSIGEREALEDAAPDDQVAALQQQFENQGAQFQQDIADIREQQFQNAESQLINERFAALEQETGIELGREQRDMVVMLGLREMPNDGQSLLNGDDWIGAGWKAYENVWNQAQTAFVTEKSTAPPPALSSGGSEIAHPPRTWEEAKASAAERLRQSRANP